MTKPDDIPQDVWDKADAIGEAIHGRHERGWVAWPLITDSGTDGPQKIVAHALLAERDWCAKKANAIGERWSKKADEQPEVDLDRLEYRGRATGAFEVAMVIRKGAA